MVSPKRLSHDDYTVGWICALPLEIAAAKAMLDEAHARLSQDSNDHNTYTLGAINGHNVAIACLPSGTYGTTSAATVAAHMLFTFPAIRCGLMVGIGGGVPSKEADIRLGDIVVSKPTDTSGGVVQYDYGKTISGGRFQRTGTLNRPPEVFLTAIAELQADHIMGMSQIPKFLSDLVVKYPEMSQFTYRGQQHDQLFEAEYDHVGSGNTCDDCDRNRLVARESRVTDNPKIHYGLIASGNQVMKYGRTRDQLARELRILCFEMEAAGLMNHFPCLVIRGICDYSDSHKNKQWQEYAAATAAAYAKELLSVVSVRHIWKTDRATNALSEAENPFRVPLDLTGVPAIDEFIGREGDVDRLWNLLQPQVSNRRKMVVLHGLGGMGKTQLAIRFARMHKDDFTAIFWLNGKDRETLMQSLASVLPRLPETEHPGEPKNEEEVEQQARQMLQWLAADGNSNWLLVFDNIDQYSPRDTENREGYDISEFVPQADHGSIIITTRLPQLTELGKSYPVQKLGTEETVQLLTNSSGHTHETNKSSTNLDPDISNLARRLDGLPLAIVIAGSFIRNTGMSFAQYLHHYEQSWHQLQSHAEPQRQYSNGNLLATWKISYDEIQKKDPSAAKLLLLLSYFDNQDIWFQLMKSGLESSNPPEWFRTTMSSEITFSTTIKTLITFSLIEARQKDSSYVMHPVVQDWCRYGLGGIDESNQVELKAIALASVGHAVPYRTEREYWVLQQRLLPHANQMLTILQNDWNLLQDVPTLQAVHNLGVLYSDQGKLKEAEEMYQRALTGYEKALGPSHTSTLATANNLGHLYADQGKLKEAKGMYQRALTGYEKALGPSHTSTLHAVHNLGNLYADQGKLKEAEEMYQRALTGYERALGPNHISTLATVYNLGHLYADQRKLKEAEEMYQRALAGYEKVLGPNHISTLTTANNLRMLCKNQGKLRRRQKGCTSML